MFIPRDYVPGVLAIENLLVEFSQIKFLKPFKLYFERKYHG